jgi:hypothetical protein
MITINNETRIINITNSGSCLSNELESLKSTYLGFEIHIDKIIVSFDQLFKTVITCDDVKFYQCNIREKSLQKVFNCSKLVMHDCIIETDLEVSDLYCLEMKWNNLLTHSINMSGKVRIIIMEGNDMKQDVNFTNCEVHSAYVKQKDLCPNQHVQELTVSSKIFLEMDFNKFPSLTKLSLFPGIMTITKLPLNIRGSVVMDREVWKTLIKLSYEYDQAIKCDTFNSRQNVVDEQGSLLIQRIQSLEALVHRMAMDIYKDHHVRAENDGAYYTYNDKLLNKPLSFGIVEKLIISKTDTMFLTNEYYVYDLSVEALMK